MKASDKATLAIGAVGTWIYIGGVDSDLWSRAALGAGMFLLALAAKKIGDTYGCAVLLKGGHNIHDANDLLYANGNFKWFYGKRIDNPNTHGTGCTLSSAIASNLAKGYDLETSVQRAKNYISGALSDMLDLGQGSGPMNHAFHLNSEFTK